jgi:hypothetical protein
LEVKKQVVDYDKVKELDTLVELCELQNKLNALLWNFHSSVITLLNTIIQKNAAWKYHKYSRTKFIMHINAPEYN